MRIGICGNDVEQRNYLKDYLIKIIKETKLECELLEFDCGEELLQNYKKMNIIFLDINMGKINGIEIAKK